MSTLSLRKIKHDSSAVDNIVTNSDGGVGIGGIDPSTLPAFIDHAVKVQNGGGLGIQSANATDNRWIFFGHGTISGDVQRAGIVNQGSDQSLALATAGSQKLIVDTAGRITKPYHPVFRATGNNTNQPLTSNTETVVQYNAVETNIGNHYNTSTYRFTAPISGFYHFSASILVSKGASARIDIIFRKNATAWVAGELQGLTTGSTNCLIANSMQGYLNAGDYVDVTTRINDNGSIYQEPKFWNFSGYLVG